MRLSCPNCDAQYEVGDNVIPQSGRDVQCSSCGKPWFQEPANKDASKTSLTARRDPAPADAAEETQPEQPKEEAPSIDPAPTPEPEARKLDQGVLDILREEAEHETIARKADVIQTVETQPDLGLQQAGQSSHAAASDVQERTARLRGISAPVDKNTTPGDMLPDIDEINSSLSSDTQPDELAQQEEPVGKKKGRRGFRFGFSLVLILAAIALLVYVYAPQIIEKLPASKSYLEGYVDKVDQLRMWLDNLMQNATAKISGSDKSS